MILNPFFSDLVLRKLQYSHLASDQDEHAITNRTLLAQHGAWRVHSGHDRLGYMFKCAVVITNEVLDFKLQKHGQNIDLSHCFLLRRFQEDLLERVCCLVVVRCQVFPGALDSAQLLFLIGLSSLLLMG